MHNPVSTAIIGLLLLAWALTACAGSPPAPQPDNEARRIEGGTDPMLEYSGETSIEERILRYPVVVRATLDRVTSEVLPVSGYWAGKYVVTLKLHLDVHEYLNGSGEDNIVGVWPSFVYYDSEAEAEAIRSGLVAERSAPYDDLEAISFLTNDFSEHDAAHADNVYYMGASKGFAGSWNGTIDVRATLNRLWLPTNNVGSGDSREYLLALPGFNLAGSDQLTESSTSTISLSALKARIAAVKTELSTPGGTADERRQCLRNRYKMERRHHYERVKYDREPVRKARDTERTVGSGAPSGSVIYEEWDMGQIPNVKPTTAWLEGDHSTLFAVADGASLPGDKNPVISGTSKNMVYPRRMTAVRPLPSGDYAVTYNEELTSPVAQLCFDVRSYDWTVIVSAPESVGVAHEFFFDPETDGDTVAADGTLGVLKPANYTEADGNSATISRLESSTSTVT